MTCWQGLAASGLTSTAGNKHGCSSPSLWVGGESVAARRVSGRNTLVPRGRGAPDRAATPQRMAHRAAASRAGGMLLSRRAAGARLPLKYAPLPHFRYGAAAACALVVTLCAVRLTAAENDVPRPPRNLSASDHPWDGGDKIDLRWQLSPDHNDPSGGGVRFYRIFRGYERDGEFEEVALVPIDPSMHAAGEAAFTVEGCKRKQPYFFRVTAVGAGGESAPAELVDAVETRRQLFEGRKLVLAVFLIVLCGPVLGFIAAARRGRPLRVRRIPGLEAVEEAVGRATEMGRPCLFVAGIQDMNDIQTIAGITILGRVATLAAQNDARVEVPTSRSLVMTAARETVQAAYLAAGRPDAYNPDLIYYVTDDQFAYVAYVTGLMAREKPAACFYMGSFFAESLVLAETGNAIGAIQMAGTAQVAQLPFFVAACDYTLLGEEFFAASAYLSGEPDQLGSLKGQDVGKLVVGALVCLGCLFATLAELTGGGVWQTVLDAMQEYLAR